MLRRNRRKVKARGLLVHRRGNGEPRTATIKEAARYAGVSRTTLYRLVAVNKIRKAKLPGHQVEVSLDDIDQLREDYNAQLKPKKREGGGDANG